MEGLGRIRVLDDITVNKIAAGEVVERPASIVKELVENSLDAGADSVHVSVVDGGRRSVSVRDDGCGMSAEDAVTAFARHATSKISSVEDLRALSSYGFRGEALASIAAVSKVVLRTREHGSGEGTEVEVWGGRVVAQRPVGCPPGTEVVVEDLFYNVPARRKSVRSRATELAHCRDVVVDFLLCRPGMSFSFSSDDELELVHSSAEDIGGSLSAAFGDAVAAGMVRGEADGDGVRVEAFLGRLEHTRSSPVDLRLFVNDRPVRSPRAVSAVVKGYGSRLMKDRYPVGLVRVFVDPAAVDVNVHPTKREVRFDDEHLVLDAVGRCVESALKGPDLTYRYDLTKFSRSFEPEAPEAAAGHVARVQSVLEVKEDEAGGEKPLVVPLAQIMDTYILAESRGNLLLIDQHAASERVVYEGVLQAMRSGREISQRLLTPLVLRLTPSEAKALEENRELVGRAGFSVEPFGGGSYAVRSIPTVLGVAQGEGALRNILGELAQMPSHRRLGLDIIWRVACHTAIRAGQTLSSGQMRQLVADLMRTESPYTCEHGRPTVIVLSPADLEKLFKRRL
ncbi:MAG: DNA mismatch repair endonuclease MutL [Candidatus Thermoplasmatota archaeon]